MSSPRGGLFHGFDRLYFVFWFYQVSSKQTVVEEGQLLVLGSSVCNGVMYIISAEKYYHALFFGLLVVAIVTVDL